MIKISRLSILFFIAGSLVIQGFCISSVNIAAGTTYQLLFDEKISHGHLLEQVELGPRIPGSNVSSEAQSLIMQALEPDWTVTFQNFTPQTSWNVFNIEIVNIVAERRADPSLDWIILGAHYDTRRLADRDPDPVNRTMPVPGANDGASGVAILLELARNIISHNLMGIRLVFFDAEDQGRLDGWPWIVGSSYYVSQLSNPATIRAAIIIDMVGDSDLNIYKEKNSFQANSDLVNSIWDIAGNLGYEEAFLDSEKYSILDDHTPFLEKNIPAVDIIDFEYPSWHTVADTIDKTSAHSLGVVGQTLESWLLQDLELPPTTSSKGAYFSIIGILSGMMVFAVARRLRMHKMNSLQIPK
ncbi:MAG: M28 family peptidase [Candidatus Thorarchaeota archaeon]